MQLLEALLCLAYSWIKLGLASFHYRFQFRPLVRGASVVLYRHGGALAQRLDSRPFFLGVFRVIGSATLQLCLQSGCLLGHLPLLGETRQGRNAELHR